MKTEQEYADESFLNSCGFFDLSEPSISNFIAMLPTEMINRVEVIDEKGRGYVNWKPTNRVGLQVQDNCKTLKIFVSQGN